MKKLKTYILPFLGWLFLAYLLCASIYILFLLKTENILPTKLFTIFIPLIIGAAIAFFARGKVLKNVENGRYIFRFRVVDIQFIAVFIFCLLIGFSQLSKSLYFNLANVLYLNTIDELPKYTQPPFLELGDWYADRQRAIPLHTFERGSLFNSDKVYVKTLFLLPVFSKEKAYESGAKAWLAFDYSSSMPFEEFVETNGKKQYDEFLSHFKKINVRAFRYFESYPENTLKRVYTELARTHSYFQSGYINIYQGMDTDRDLWAQYYVRQFLYYFIFVIIPLLIVSSLFVRTNHSDSHGNPYQA
ncbi:hypothetical protein [Sphingobacterium hungaricum]|uniref:Uncharacterized protein n=1 Tax=Sphingobacterium hungaricum TaxID=2082723 RepID=A0A928YQ58_9SPHI|nr:hypothetical protein [Sphingobacterium hungaricum]MBE8713609.1 hypothetical protein [Sphingobacterium hungaricum]